jgi:disulfide bond formation protein DsbB
MTTASGAPPGSVPSFSSYALAYLAWVVALVATLGSLFFSEVMKLPPCNLCWYQRVFLYPLVVLLPIGIFLRDRRLAYYTLPLAALGLAVALYHNLLYYGVISEDLAPCTQGVPCTSRQIDWFGFVGIPLLGLGAFVFILVSLVLHERTERKGSDRP